MVFSGADGRMLYEFQGSELYSYFGWRVIGPGDVDGDGRADFAIAAPFSSSGRGRVSLYSGRDGALIFELGGTEDDSLLGFGLGAAGDVNGDSLPDLAVGLPGADLESTDDGVASVYLSGPCAETPVCVSSPNSAGFGAVIGSNGELALSENAFVLSASFCPPGALGFFRYRGGSFANPFGDGVSCLGGSAGGIHRIPPPAIADPAGVASARVDFTSPPMNAGPGEIRPLVPRLFGPVRVHG